jgi:hypothetical protein
MRIQFVFLTLLLALGCAGQQQGNVVPAPQVAPVIGVTNTGPMPVYILAGQSNAAGAGPVCDLTAAQATPATDGYLYDGGACAPDVLGRWLPITTGLGCDHTYIGPELGFAKSMPGPVYVVKCAVPSTSMDAFWRSPSAGGAFPGYVALLDTIKAGLAAAQIPGGCHLAGLLWLQGESDAIAGGEAADSYRERLTAFIGDFRHDVGEPALPVLLAKIHLYPGEGRGPDVQAAETAVAATVPGVSIFSTDDLVLGQGPDEGGQGEYEIGRRFAAAVQSIAP